MLKNMSKKKTRGYTLIELVAVLVIMAILALIVTPLVMNIIRKARIAADKRSVDAYGRSIELAIAGYLLDNGKFPTKISDLTIEYSGDTVSCTTEQINSDSSVYLAGCTVKNRIIEEYTYGKYEAPKYSVGDHISYNGITYYVIEDSEVKNNTVKLLKEDPLKKTEIDNLNLDGITVTEINTYGTLRYGNSADYSSSTAKQVVDAWKDTAVKSEDSVTARLITKDEIINNLGYVLYRGSDYIHTELTPGWVYNNNFFYFTMSQYSDHPGVYGIGNNGDLSTSEMAPNGCMIRPVLEISKSAELTKLAS